MDDVRAQGHLLISTVIGMPMHSVTRAGPEGVFGSDATPKEALIREGDARVSGAATPVNTYGTGESLEMSWDLTVAEEAFECR